MKNSSQQKYYSVTEVAKLLQVHWQSVHNFIKRGELEALKLGRGYRISQAAIDDFLARRTKGKQKWNEPHYTPE